MKRSLNEKPGWSAYNRVCGCATVRRCGAHMRAAQIHAGQDEPESCRFASKKGAEVLHTDPTRTRESLNAKPSLLRLAAPLAALLMFHTLSRALPYHVWSLTSILSGNLLHVRMWFIALFCTCRPSVAASICRSFHDCQN